MRLLRTSVILLTCTGVIAACSRNEAVPQDDIRNVTWTLVEVNGAPVNAASLNRPATLTLDGDGRASGNSGCNQFGGEYTLDGAELRFGAIAMTRMACPAGMDVEAAYAQIFDATRSWRVVNGMLELTADNRVLARFRRQT